MRSLNERFSDTKLSNIFRQSLKKFNTFFPVEISRVVLVKKFLAQHFFRLQTPTTFSRCTFFSVLLSRRRFRSLATNVVAAWRSGGGH
jgi:hypothetical protein